MVQGTTKSDKSFGARMAEKAGHVREWAISALKKTGAGIRTAAENGIEKMRNAYDSFHLTIAEGNYHVRPRSLWTLLTGKSREPELSAPTTFVGHAMFDTGRNFGKRMMWASAIALISMQALGWVALGLAVAGGAMFYLEYAQSKRAREETVTEVNFAGQTVQGTRADLYHLHNAQEQIMSLSDVFKRASMDSTSDTIRQIMEIVADRATRVKVLDGGRYNAGTGRYEFSEPAIKLVKDRPQPRQFVVLGDEGELAALSAKPGFDAAAPKKTRILILEEELPPEIIARIEQARAAQTAPAMKPPAAL